MSPEGIKFVRALALTPEGDSPPRLGFLLIDTQPSENLK